MDFDSEFEDIVLAQSFRDVAFLKRAVRICDAHHFSTKERSWIWGVISKNWSKYKERTSGKILAANARDDFDQVDKRRPYVVLAKKLLKKKPKNPKSVLDELENFVRTVSVHLAIEEAAGHLEKGSVEEAEKAAGKAGRAQTAQRNYTHIPWVEGFDERQAQRKYEKEHPDEFTVIPFGFPKLDKVLGGGGRKGELALVMGTTGRGKSVFITNAQYSCIQRQFNAVVFNFEMPARQAAMRQDARATGVKYSQFKSYDFKPSELRQLKQRMGKARDQFANRLHIISMPVRSANINDVRAVLDDLRDDYDFEADAIYLDSADHLRSIEAYGGNFRLQQSEVYWAAKELAEEDGHFVMSSCHAGKEWATKVATAEASSESYDKSRIADMVLSLNDPNETNRRGRKTTISDDDFEDDDNEEIIGPMIKEGAKHLEGYLGKYRDGESRFKFDIEFEGSRMTMKEASVQDDNYDEEDEDDD